MNYRAIGDSVIIEVPELSKESKTDSGIFLIQDDPTKKATIIGTVLSVGEGKVDTKTGVLTPPPLKEGDKVVVSMATGISLGGNRRMIKVDDIFAVVAE